MREALSPATAAILIEGIQGEGGISPATPEYLLGLRNLCTEQKLLLFMDGVQDGHFRTGRFQSYQRLLESVPESDSFLPDGISMAKSLGGGFPIGAFWVREPYAELLGPGTHASTFGGTPLGCAVALKVFEVIAREHLAENARQIGALLLEACQSLAREYPTVVKTARGVGLMIGIELAPQAAGLNMPNRAPSLQFVNRLHEAGLLTIPSGTHVVRLLPPLNLTQLQAEEGLSIIANLIRNLAEA